MLKLLTEFFTAQSGTLENVAVQQQRQYLYALPEPQDDIGRSYLQYKCQNFLKGKSRYFTVPLLNIASAIVMCCVIPVFLCRKQVKKAEADSVYITDVSKMSALAKSINRDLQKATLVDGNSLTKRDLSFVAKIWKKHPLSLFFLLKNVVKIAAYSSVIEQYGPKRIICSCEYSFTSSILTAYCESRSVEHINFMHGDKVFDIVDSFCRFTKFYVWDEYYIGLFKQLRFDDKQTYIAELPPSMQLKLPYVAEAEKYDYTYYLQAESNAELERLGEILSKMSERYRIKIRLHPIYSNAEVIFRIFGGSNIVVEKNKTLEWSFAATKAVISKYSTVLNQAYYANIPIVIDDISNPKQYGYLQDCGYIMLSKSHKLLSNVIKNRG